MKLALAILAAALFLPGCGHSAPSRDPFVGTWQAQMKQGPTFVISKHEPGYLVTATRPGDPSYEGLGEFLNGRGKTLTITIELPAQVETIKLTVSPHGRLQAIDKGVAGEDGPGPLFITPGLTRRATLVRISNSTMTPTPTPLRVP